MARKATQKITNRRGLTSLPEAVVTARAVAWGLPRFAVRLVGLGRYKPSLSSWARRPCE